MNAFRRGFFANLYLPAMLCEKPTPEIATVEGGGDEARRAEHPTDDGTHPKGLDGEAAAHDYIDRCGDFWFGRPVVQRWLDGIYLHPLVKSDVEKHLDHLRRLQDKELGAGARARLEGENTSLRAVDRIAATDRAIATDVLAAVFTLPPPG